MDLDPKYVAYVLRTLMQAVARERVENYALRLVLADAGVASFEKQDEAKRVAAKRYARLLEIAGEDQPEQPDPLDFLKAFEGPVQ
jgi:hypothetical protein